MIPLKKTISIFCCFLFITCAIQAQVFFDQSSSTGIAVAEGETAWSKSIRSLDQKDNSTSDPNSQETLLYSTESYQSNDGFRLTFEYATASIAKIGGYNFAVGLISDETNLSKYTGSNPFGTEKSLYSIGFNLANDSENKGISFSNGSKSSHLSQFETEKQFPSGETSKVTIEIGIGGYWSYRIDDTYVASGVLVEGIDLSKNYHVAIYGTDDTSSASVRSIVLEKNYAPGERAEKLRGTWSSGIDVSLMDVVADLRTLDSFGVGFTSGASQSALHNAPHILMERLALEGASGNDTPIDLIAPTWGDLSLAEPEVDKVKDDMLKVIDAGFKVKAYTNCENFVGTNASQYQAWVERWFEWCDTNPEAQAFINSQPYHTGVWNRTTQQYEDASDTYPYRKYMFCYAEFILKDHAIRYGEYINSWIFDDGSTMQQNGDNATSGLIEEQRIYQAYANAVHAGNPEIPIAFNNGRSNLNYDSYPFAHAIRFEDFTFGHAFGGNNNHAEQVNGNQFNLNYRHITRMTETNGYIHAGGNWDWDDQIVGNFHSKLSTTAWKFGPVQAWEQDDFNQWTLEALQAGGAMLWDGSYNRGITGVYDWVVVMLRALDDYLYENGVSINGEESSSFIPDPNKTYYIDNPHNNLRLAADGSSEAPYATSTNTTGDDVEWQFVDKGNGYWHIQRAAGGISPRLRTDNSLYADMQTTVNEGVYTYYQFTAGAIDNSHFITLPDGPSNFKRLQISPNGEIRFFPTTSNGTWESFTFTEVVPSEQVVHITKRNAPGFAIDGNHDAANTQNVYLWSADPNNVNQQWIEIDRGNGYYSYQKMGTNHCLDGGAPGAVNGQNVYLWNCGEGNNQNQHWQKVDAGSGAFKLIKRNDEGFAINGGSAGENAQNVNLFNATNNSQNLQWFITPIDVEIKVDGEIDNTIVSSVSYTHLTLPTTSRV